MNPTDLIKEKSDNGIAKIVAIKDILIRKADLIDMLEEYHKAKLKLLSIADVSGSLCVYCKDNKVASCCESCLDNFCNNNSNTQ